jgi:hypothetical protein
VLSNFQSFELSQSNNSDLAVTVFWIHPNSAGRFVGSFEEGATEFVYRVEFLHVASQSQLK